MSITIEIMGGLGNQLFQIFTLITYSIKSKKPFYFENKPITCGWRNKYYWDTLLLNKLKGFIKTPLHKSLMYYEPFFHYRIIPEPPRSPQNIKLHGYFQSYKYFEEHKEVIFNMINLKESQQCIKEKVSPYLPTTLFEQFVSLHFRVGDYAKQPQNYPLIKVEYYEKALEQLILDTNNNYNWVILYFCEENDVVYVNEKINYLKKNEKFKDFIFIKAPSELDDWEQMLLMSLCKHHIIANSTFSWWGAYLSERNIIYYPNQWFGPGMGKKNMKDMFLDGWKEIK
jgi:hypothetical protein